ncbi:hypothetical protein ANO14919_041280 [Xylariales sp. No.14919]|nr:hypothetical protein ANO14919_041280 [Xylariales sp. No.14919]
MATQDTRMNGLITTTNYGSSFYEPPEVDHPGAKILPRRYDIWSMAVVSLEMIIWLLQGYHSVQRFHTSVKKAQGSPDRETCYKRMRIGGKEEVSVEPKVVEWLDFLEKDGACGPDIALRALLDIIRHDLLVPDVALKEEESGEQENEREKEMNDFTNVQVNSNPHRLKQPEHEGVTVAEVPLLMLTRATYTPIKEEKKLRATATEFNRLLRERFADDDFAADFWYPERLHQERTAQPHLPDSLLNPTRGASSLNPTSKSMTSSSISS